MIDCNYCPYTFPEFLARCPHCGRPSLFPNVTMAADPAEEDALTNRYINAKAHALTRGVLAIVDEFESAIANESCAVLVPRNRYELNRLLSGDNQIYPTYYALIDGPVLTPSNDRWGRFRGCVDEHLFPYHKKEIHFAALSLDGIGVLTFADLDFWQAFSLVFDEKLIEYRASVFEENSRLYQEKHHTETTQNIPYGYRATWPNRAKLAIAKLTHNINVGTQSCHFPILLLRNTGVQEKEEFIEVHIYGPITIRTFKEVVVKKVSFFTRVKHKVAEGPIHRKLKDKLSMYGVAYREQP